MKEKKKNLKIEKHLKKINQIRKMPECKFCNREFKSEKGLNIHISQKHKEELKKEEQRKKKEEQRQREKKKKRDEKKKQKLKKHKNLPDHVEEYFKDQEGSREAIKSRELFTADKDNIDLKTDLKSEEIALLNVMKFNNKILEEKGLNPIYDDFIINFMRLKVSKDRKSRAEFVGLNQNENEEEDKLSQINKNLESLTGSRK